ncbi:hypothetical protein U9M48_028563 [Paspalum notatum var. saurae]|uniref:Trichome birefringence-like N-terminal domain-containing protein n=1 Tax=Paspalum notatum var. saurae TaxID=547442 RepID=A0AAQ3TWP2_PASNO
MRRLIQSVSPAVAPLPALLLISTFVVFLVLTARGGVSFVDISAWYSSSSASPSSPPGAGPRAVNFTATPGRVPKGCDIFRGEWVPDGGGIPYYTNRSCPHIQEHQNCLKYGRPDLGFLRWRWRPSGCDLPRFNAAAFLDSIRGRSLAFVGDSLARNHMQSLMCLLSKVEYPKDISKKKNLEFSTMLYESHNCTVAIFWSPFLVKANKSEDEELWHLYLDEPDDAWLAEIGGFDYIVISAGNWFTRPSMFHEAGDVVGCHYCLIPGVKDLSLRYSQRIAFRSALRALTSGFAGFSGTVILRTLSPTSHFEDGEWNKGGDCRRTRPYAANEIRMVGLDLDFYTAQVEEFSRAKAEAETETARPRARLELMDTTAAMLLRPDGHPSRYGHWAHVNVTLYNDCVHWCLPGPIDVWNEMLFQMLLPD